MEFESDLIRRKQPARDGVVSGNSNNLPSKLNSRLIQMVIAKNLTLAQAWGIGPVDR